METGDLQSEEIQQLLLLDQIQKNCEFIHSKNPFDADNLTKWGGAILQMAEYVDVQESLSLIKVAISKLKEATEMNPQKHEAMWCLGNAHTSEAFLTFDPLIAQRCFEKATESFAKALNLVPQNEIYLKSLEASMKAPDMHKEFHEEFARQAKKGGSSDSSNIPEKKVNSDLKYDIGGWIILGIGLLTWVAMNKSQVPPAYY